MPAVTSATPTPFCRHCRRLKIPGLFLALLSVCAAQTRSNAAKGGQTLNAQFLSVALGHSLEYIVYLPPNFEVTPGIRYPVIYLLHGRGDNLRAWLEVRDDMDRRIVAGTVPPFIAILPDAPSNHRAGYYLDSQFTGTPGFPAGEKIETAITRDLIEEIDRRFPTQPDRRNRIVGGYSMGGAGALRLVLRHPDLFGAAIVLSPAVYFPLPPAKSSTREFGAYGLGNQLFNDDRYRAENYPALLPSFLQQNQPVFMYIAAGDREAALADPREAAHDLDYEAHTLYIQIRRQALITSEFRIVDGGHEWKTWRPTYLEGICLAFQYLARHPK